jgi:hypothetical protein
MGYECWCSNYKGTHGPPAPPNQCNTICTDAGQKCGGFCRMTEFYIECSCTSYDVNTGQGVCNGVHVNVGAVICGAGFDRSKCVAVQASPNGEKRRKKNPQPPSLRAHALRAFVEFCCTTLSAPTYALTHAPALTLVLLKEALRHSSSITHARPCPHPCAAEGGTASFFFNHSRTPLPSPLCCRRVLLKEALRRSSSRARRRDSLSGRACSRTARPEIFQPAATFRWR